MGESGYILTLDQGTSSTKAGLIDIFGNVVCSAQIPISQTFPKAGWVEQNPWEIFNSTVKALKKLLQKSLVRPRDIHSIGITNQRETTILWDSRSGEPLYNAVGWQCRRTSTHCQKLIDQGLGQKVRRITGLPIDPEFSATKISWLLDHIPDGRLRASKGEIKFGTVDSWLIWHLTKGQVHVTDVTNASRTMLLDLRTLQWSSEMLDLFEIPRDILPELVPSNAVVGKIHKEYLDGESKQIIGVIGDQQASLFGQACFKLGMTKCTYGTGAFMLTNTGNGLLNNDDGLIQTVAWLLDDEVEYALEGAVLSAGGTVNWALSNLGLAKDVLGLQRLAETVEDSNGVVVVPAFAGLGSPYWDSNARGSIHGLSFSTKKAHIARAILESTAFQCADMLESFSSSSDISIKELRTDGGGAASNLLMQRQADLLQMKLQRSQHIESTMLGAAHISGLQIGFWEDMEHLEKLWKHDVEFVPRLHGEEYRILKNQWSKAISRSKKWL